MGSETLAPVLIKALYPMVAISLTFMVLRFCGKHRYGKRFAWDDIVLVFAWVCHAAFAGIITASTNHGMGRHLATLSRQGEYETHRLLAVSYLFATLSTAASKSSFAITLLYLAQEAWEKVALWFIIISVNVTLGLADVFLFTSCSPVDKIFDPRIEGTCLNGRMLHRYITFSASWSTAADFILVMYPWYLIWGMNMRKVEKLGICIAMSFGVLSGVTGVVRIVHMQNGVKWKDWTYSSIDVLVWLAAETALIIVAASIPFLRGLLKEIRQRVSSGKSGGGSSNNNVQLSLGTFPDPGNTESQTAGSKDKSAAVTEVSGVSDERSDKGILYNETATELGNVTTTSTAKQ